MPNIKFNYLYSDGANYKNYSFIIFENSQEVSIKYLHNLIQSKLISETWFYVDQWKLPDLHFGTWDNEIDHTFHEFESIEYTSEAPNTQLTLKKFINLIKACNRDF